MHLAWSCVDNFYLTVLSMAVETFSVNPMDVVAVAEELNLLTVNGDDLQEEFGSKNWISDAVHLFNKQIGYDRSLSLKEYFS